MTQEIAIIGAHASHQDSSPRPYGLLCSLFIARASHMYSLLPAFHKEAAMKGGLDEMEAEGIAHLARQAQKEHDAVVERFLTRAAGWNLLATKLPLQIVKQRCADKRDLLIVEHAERTTAYLTPQIGQVRVAQLLPQELHTEEAAAFMRTHQHHTLESAIHTALTFK